jgi:hypothetical protein
LLKTHPLEQQISLYPAMVWNDETSFPGILRRLHSDAMITSCEVHFALQQRNNILSEYDNAIAIDAIARDLHVNSRELLPHLDVLRNMQFINYTDRKNEKVRLTFTGKFAQIAEFVLLTMRIEKV